MKNTKVALHVQSPGGHYTCKPECVSKRRQDLMRRMVYLGDLGYMYIFLKLASSKASSLRRDGQRKLANDLAYAESIYMSRYED